MGQPMMTTDDDDVPMDRSTPPVIRSQSIRVSSASSGQPLDTSAMPSPASREKRKRGRLQADDDYDAEIAELKRRRELDQMMFDRQAREMAELRQFMVAMSQKNDSKLEAIINSLGGAMPLASVQPSQVDQVVLLQGAPARPTMSGSSSLPSTPRLIEVPFVSLTPLVGSADSPTPPPIKECPLHPCTST